MNRLSAILKKTCWRRLGEEPHFKQQFPDDYVVILKALGAGEGFIGPEFLRLYEPSELPLLNSAYHINDYLPSLLLVGSNGCGEAYAYDADNSWALVRVPFIPFDGDYLEMIAPTLIDALGEFADRPLPMNATSPLAPNPETLGKEITEIHPLCLGGSPTDPKNRAAFPIDKHIQSVVFWNKTYRHVKSQAS